MRIISHRAIVQFVLSHPNAKSGLDHWYRTIKADMFQDLAELRAVWPTLAGSLVPHTYHTNQEILPSFFLFFGMGTAYV